MYTGLMQTCSSDIRSKGGPLSIYSPAPPCSSKEATQYVTDEILQNGISLTRSCSTAVGSIPKSDDSGYKKGNSPCAIIKDYNALRVSGKVQRSSASLLQLFRVLHATSVSLGSNVVKLQVWKDKNILKSKYVINFFEHLNDFKWKNSKLESCRSRRDL